MHFRVQRLDPAVHDFREARVAGDVLDRNPRLFECSPGSTG